jgi:DNA-binding NtrC family response regulator
VASAKKIHGISPDAMATLMNYRWPGNIRELQNVLERALVLAPGGVIESEDLPGLDQDEAAGDEPCSSASPSLRQWMKEQEKKYLLEKLAASGGNVALAARMCRIGLRTLSRKIRVHGLDSRNIKRVVSLEATNPDEASELLATASRTNFP